MHDFCRNVGTKWTLFWALAIQLPHMYIEDDGQGLRHLVDLELSEKLFRYSSVCSADQVW